jgi:hypothetical protein
VEEKSVYQERTQKGRVFQMTVRELMLDMDMTMAGGRRNLSNFPRDWHYFDKQQMGLNELFCHTVTNLTAQPTVDCRADPGE